MILCFGTFVKVLNLCNRGLPQEKFVPRVAWVLDRRNSSLASELNFSVKNPDGMKGNKAVVSRLLSCGRPLVLREKELPTLEVARERFNDKVMPYIDDLKVTNAVLTTLYIISSDETIEDERKECFRKYLGMSRAELLQQTTFNVPDFFARVLLYTIFVDNNEGRPYAKEITNDFIENAVRESWVEIKWDATTQMLEILHTEARKIRDRINSISELRLSLMEEPAEPLDYVNTDWLGADISDLFPSRYGKIEFKDPATKKKVLDKLAQYSKLVQEFVECLTKERQSVAQQSVNWPIFPNERMKAICQQLEDVSNELLVLGIFPDRFNPR